MKTKKKSSKKTPAPHAAARVKAGTSKASAAQKKILYAKAFLANGGNKTQAAVTAGFKPGRAAEQAGWRLSKDVVVMAMIKDGHEKAAQEAGLTVERTLKELARVAYSNPQALKDEKGNWIPLEKLPPEVAAAIAAYDEEPVFDSGAQKNGKDKKNSVAGFHRKIKLWDKNSALEKAMKYHRLYDDTPPPASVGTVVFVVGHPLDAKI